VRGDLPSTTGIEGGFLKPPHLIPSGVALRASLSPAGRGEKKRGIFPSPQRGEGKDEGASIFPFIKPTKEARGSKAELVLVSTILPPFVNRLKLLTLCLRVGASSSPR